MPMKEQKAASATGMRCVRPGPIGSGIGGGSRFYISAPVAGEQVVYDAVTGLTWQKSYGTGNAWQQALFYCEGLTCPRIVQIRKYREQYSFHTSPSLVLN